MTPTINNTDPQYVESPTRHAIMKTMTSKTTAEQLRRIYGREN